MSDNKAVFEGIERHPGVAYTAIIGNMRGFHDAVSQVNSYVVFLKIT